MLGVNDLLRSLDELAINRSIGAGPGANAGRHVISASRPASVMTTNLYKAEISQDSFRMSWGSSPGGVGGPSGWCWWRSIPRRAEADLAGWRSWVVFLAVDGEVHYFARAHAMPTVRGRAGVVLRPWVLGARTARRFLPRSRGGAAKNDPASLMFSSVRRSKRWPRRLKPPAARPGMPIRTRPHPGPSCPSILRGRVGGL
jgi:hypothetical protein